MPDEAVPTPGAEGAAAAAPMSEIQIQWLEAQRRFHIGKINAELRHHIGGQTVEMEYVRHTATPDDLFDLKEAPEDSTEKVKVFHCTPKESLLRDERFFERIRQPVQIDITVKPKDPKNAASAGPTGEITESCLVRIVPPQAKIHWVDERTQARDGIIEVEADGEDTFQLRCELHRFIPHEGAVVEDTTVQFTHKTLEMYPPDIFGPHPEDLPRNVAKKGMGNRRNLSRWKSHLALPDSSKPNVAVPVTGSIRCKAWGEHDIAERVPDEIIAAEDARVIAVQMIPVNLVPVKLTAELVEPLLPIPADGQPHEIVIEIRRERDGKPAKRAEVAFELVQGAGPPGGALDPLTAKLVPEDAGRVRLTYTPPELIYRRGTVYLHEVSVTIGAGAAKKEIAKLPLHLNPSLDAEIKAKKKEFDFEPATLDFDAGETPELIRGMLKLDVENWGPAEKHSYEIVSARVWLESKADSTDALGDGSGLPADSATASAVTDVDDSAEAPKPGEVKTNSEGKYELKLPELTPGWTWAKASPKAHDLETSEDPLADLAMKAKEVIDKYDQSRVNARWYLFDEPVNRNLRTHRLTYSSQLCRKEEIDAPKILSGAELLRTAMVFSPAYERMHEQQWAIAATNLGSFQNELVGLAVNFTNFGDKFANFLGWIGKHLAWIGDSFLLRPIRWVTGRFAYAMQMLADKLWSRMSAAQLTGPMKQAWEGLKGACGSIVDFANGLTTPGQRFELFFTGLANLVINTVKMFANAAWTVFVGCTQAVSGLIIGTGRLIGWALDGTQLRRWQVLTKRWMRSTFRHLFKDEELLEGWGLGKLAEALYNKVLDELAFAQSAGEGAASMMRNLRVMTNAATEHVSGTWQDVFDLDVPEVADLRRHDFINGTSSLAQNLREWEETQISTDYYLDVLDAALLVAECILALVAILVPPIAAYMGWANAARIGATAQSLFVAQAGATKSALTHVEVGMSAARAGLVRFPQTIVALGNASKVISTYGAEVTRLTGTIGAAT